MKDIKSQKFETEQTLKINKQCNISNKTNPQKAINLLSGSAYLEGSFVNWKQKRTKLKIEFNGIYLSPGCQRLFMRGFRFRSNALWPARKTFSGGRNIGPVAPKQLMGKKTSSTQGIYARICSYNLGHLPSLPCRNSQRKNLREKKFLSCTSPPTSPKMFDLKGNIRNSFHEQSQTLKRHKTSL